MSFSYDLSTSIGVLRLRIPDDNSLSYTFEDAELQSFLTQAGGSISIALLYAWTSLCSQSNSSSGDDIRVGDVKVSSSKSRGPNYCALAKQQMELINSGLANDIIGVGETMGLYQEDRDTNREEKQEGILVDRGFNEDTFDNECLLTEVGEIDED
jgi:hypothetical protein